MIHFPIIKQFCCGFCSVCLVFTVKHLHSLFSRANHRCNRVIHKRHFPPPSLPAAESRVCGRADVSVQLHGDLSDEQVGLPHVLAVLVAARTELVLLSAPQEEEQLQSAQHKQPGAQHHPDQREASGQQVVLLAEEHKIKACALYILKTVLTFWIARKLIKSELQSKVTYKSKLYELSAVGCRLLGHFEVISFPWYI